jgi:hypothetical protein
MAVCWGVLVVTVLALHRVMLNAQTAGNASLQVITTDNTISLSE